MIKITHVIICLNQGGAETMLYKLCKNLDKSKYDVSVISLMGRGVFADKLEDCGVKVYSLGLTKFNAPIVLLKHIRLIKKIKPSVVQAWMYHANVISLICKPFYTRAIYISGIRGGLQNYCGHKRLTRFLIKANVYLSRFSFVTLNNSKQSLDDHAKVGMKKQKFIPNGFEIDIFKPSDIQYKNFRNDNELKADTTIMGIIARNHKDKNIELFIQVANNILSKRDDICFLIAGRDCKNILISNFLDKKEYLDKFIVMESVDSSLYLPVLDLYLSTSKTEGFPNVVGEAMLCGVPVVASNVGDCRVVLDKYGYIFDLDDDIDDIANNTLVILDNTSDTLKKDMRKYVIDNYSIDAVTKQFEKHYD